jgi:HEPN domain-containing protein
VTPKDARYRLSLAQGFSKESRQDLELERWRSAVDNAQLSVENSAKAVLGLIAPVGKTHNPAYQLREAVEKNLFPSKYHSSILRLAEISELLGFDVHVRTDYGDEVGGKTPWELFNDEDARFSVHLADEALEIAIEVVEGILS